ncbi:hypothetical protein KR067_005921 [Drosophila pandora]|nr:hypothetical protein KR067_005921 [Drosophila pandora]
MRVCHLNLLVLSVGLWVLLAESGTSATPLPDPVPIPSPSPSPSPDPNVEPRADVQQLTLADVNQAAEQQEMPAVRPARQFGFGRGGFGRGGFGGGGRGFRRRGCCGGFGGPGFGPGFGGPGFGPGFGGGFGGFYPRPPIFG